MDNAFIGFTTVKAARKISPDVVRLSNGTYAAVKGLCLFGVRASTANVMFAVSSGIIPSRDLALI